MITKFKTRQYILMTDSPDLMLAKVSRYTVENPQYAQWCPDTLMWYSVVLASVFQHGKFVMQKLHNTKISKSTIVISLHVRIIYLTIVVILTHT